MPYEKFQKYGPEQLSDSELLAIVLRTGAKDVSAVELAEQVLKLAKYPRRGLLGLHEISLRELMSLKGIGPVKAVKLKCLAELSIRFSKANAEKGLNIHKPSTVAEYYMEQLRHRKTECVILVCLDGKNQIIAERRLSDGSVNMALISPREIFLTALETGAVNLILVHNHPSGDPSPSKCDRELTEHVRAIGKEFGIPLLDHIIIGDRVFYSFRSEGLL